VCVSGDHACELGSDTRAAGGRGGGGGFVSLSVRPSVLLSVCLCVARHPRLFRFCLSVCHECHHANRNVGESQSLLRFLS
jgi:hypothetical protein